MGMTFYSSVLWAWNFHDKKIFLSFLGFLGPHLWHMEVPRLGVKSEQQLPATAPAMPDLNPVFDLHHSSQQHQILNPLTEARVQTRILMDTSWVHDLPSHNGNSKKIFNKQVSPRKQNIFILLLYSSETSKMKRKKFVIIKRRMMEFPGGSGG